MANVVKVGDILSDPARLKHHSWDIVQDNLAAGFQGEVVVATGCDPDSTWHVIVFDLGELFKKNLNIAGGRHNINSYDGPLGIELVDVHARLKNMRG